jgi:quercetin dioxygenase-like cupin family protein
MRLSALFLTLLLLATSTVAAQTPAPPAATASNGVLMQLTLDEVQPKSIATVGMVRTTLEPGGSFRAFAGSGPAVHFVESGSITVRTEGDARAEVVASGSALVLPPGATAEIRNDGEAPATTLGVLAAADATTEAETSVTHSVLAQQRAELPEAPVTVTLARVTIEPGDHLELPAEAAQVVYVTVERGQAFLLSGQGINRGAEPMEVYLLTFSGDATVIASPAA